ncbi:hypothetical protein [Isoptericola sediminis]|uniref:Uncharacterized protein n=1 Tax=Isoptericola sediminis TaxID=2733572 RepID=A0A849JTZ9_9MICO|nr:hypothetical protein [Isoptericola sediminis]NNU26782.1 hypothetical protein [Isoptericola sediminis]
MSIPQTQQHSPEAETAYLHLAEVMAEANKTITFAGLTTGSISPDVAREASDRAVRRATVAYKRLLADSDDEKIEKVLAQILAELTVSTAATWVDMFHDAIFNTPRSHDQ